MIGYNMYPIPNQFILPLQQRLEYRDCLHFEYSVVMLGCRKLLRHETCRSAGLPFRSLTIHGTYTCYRSVANNPNWIRVRRVDRFQYWRLACHRFDIVHTRLVYGQPHKRAALPLDSSEWSCPCSYVGHEMREILNESQKSLEIVLVLRYWPVPDPRHLVRVRVYPIIIDNVTKTFQLFRVQVQLALLEKEFPFSQFIEDHLEMFFMLLLGVAIDEDIIEIYVDKSPNKISEYRRHNSLERRRRVAVSNLHPIAQEGSINCGKRCFPHIFWINAYLFICVRHIDLRSIFSSSNFGSNLLLVWERRYVFHSVVVSLPRIESGAKLLPILLGDAQYWRRLWNIRFHPPTSFLIQFDLVEQLRF